MIKNQKNFKIEGLSMETVISSIGEGLIILDRNYKVVLLNPKALEILGYKKNEIIGKDLRGILKIIKNKKELTVEDWPIEKTFKTNQVITTNLEDDFSIGTNKQKNHLAVTFSISPLSNKLENDTSKLGVVIVIHDVNKDRELDRVKSGFISIASHQLRTPLTSIRWCSEMLMSGSHGQLNESQLDLSREIHDGTSRLNNTINLLLGISRVESGKIPNKKVPIDLSKITEEVIKELSSEKVEKKSISFNVKTNINPSLVMLDKSLVRQVIYNLFSNALNYTDKDGVIVCNISVDKKKNEVVYSVQDNGIGIPSSSHNKIFSKFFRANNAILKVSNGTGLGLAFTKDIVVYWGGRIWFETKEGKGSTFSFTIPLSKN